ncbi:hypothetical protein L218DRAFT_988071 [Marasmius fiardii PR-910]|nr:hypothetical protein L218DRAFT_988071 [Marasmius fiardii PR-910]
MIIFYSFPYILTLLILALGVSAQNSAQRQVNDSALFRAAPKELASNIMLLRNDTLPLVLRDVGGFNDAFSHLAAVLPVARVDINVAIQTVAPLTLNAEVLTTAAPILPKPVGGNFVPNLDLFAAIRCPEGTTCSDTPGFCQNSTITNSNNCEGGLNKRQQSANCETECLDGETLPVLNFHLKPGQTDGLYESMCKGMFDRNGGKSTDKDVLNWGGSKDPLYNQRRKDAGCKGFCTEVNQFLPRSERVECDEYPPASTKQGGAKASRKCITWNQNSGYQGPQIKNFASKSGCNLQEDDRFIIRMKDGCSYLGLNKRQDGTSANTTLSARQNSPSQLSLSGFNDTLLSIDNSTTPKWISVHLDELQAGQYTVTVPLEFQITELVVLDGEGVEYASIESPSGSTMLNFTLDVDLDTGASLIAVTDRKMNISFTATAQLSVETAPRSSNSAGSLPLLASISFISYIFLVMELIGIGI